MIGCGRLLVLTCVRNRFKGGMNIIMTSSKRLANIMISSTRLDVIMMMSTRLDVIMMMSTRLDIPMTSSTGLDIMTSPLGLDVTMTSSMTRRNVAVDKIT